MVRMEPNQVKNELNYLYLICLPLCSVEIGKRSTVELESSRKKNLFYLWKVYAALAHAQPRNFANSTMSELFIYNAKIEMVK